jgi:hypothetical protein
MFSQPMSVPDAVRVIIGDNNAYSQALALGIANYTALAEKIKPDIERLIGSEVNLNTIVVAIKRLADSLRKKPQDDTKASATTKAKMSLTGSVIDINFQKENEQDDELVNILNEFFEQEDRYNLFQTNNNFTLITEDAEDTRRVVGDAIAKFKGKLMEGLSKITISLSKEEEEKSQYNLLLVVSNILYNHQIPIHSAFFTPSEMILILSNKDAGKAYDLIWTKLA